MQLYGLGKVDMEAKRGQETITFLDMEQMQDIFTLLGISIVLE